MARTWNTAIRVRWGETDPMGIVFYPSYFTWFDHATHELFASSGRSLIAWLHEDGISAPIVECGARFHAPVFADDEIVVASTAVDVRSRSLRLEHVITRADDEVATGFEVRVIARLGSDGKLDVSPMPDEMRTWLEG